MIKAWLNFESIGIFATLALLYYGVAVALVLLVFSSPLKATIKTFTGVVGPFFSSVAILFALLTSFLSYDILERNRQATKAVQSEAGELQNVYSLSVASVTDMSEIRKSLQTYVASVLKHEWPPAAGHSAPDTDAAYDEMLRELSDPSISRDASAAVHVAMLSAAVRAGTARNNRITLSTDRTAELKWISVLLLGVITQVAIAVVHLERRRAMVAALTVFSTGAIVALGLVALQEDPFGGVFKVSPVPLERLLTLPTTLTQAPDAQVQVAPVQVAPATK
ncbi:DUF4239 domain-containing protein [Rhodopseudomonas pseudopalustris]|uniref:bestrophin-like domain n=1 Tax=Rhodopseudomonas pseudopalustris TaxID=1513892 RepID=UPI003F9E5BFD